MSDPTVDTTVTPVADPAVAPEAPVEAPVEQVDVVAPPAGLETITEVAARLPVLDGAEAAAAATDEHSLGWTVQHVFREAETDAVALGNEAKADVEALVVEIKAAA